MSSVGLFLLFAFQLSVGNLALPSSGSSNGLEPAQYLHRNTPRLLLVNILNRHGDRAPTNLSPFDGHSREKDLFWPRGLGQLTSTGLRRMYNVGHELRRHYNYHGRNLLDYDTDSILALTSNITRCVESQNATLQGFYEMGTSLARGWQVASELRHNKTGNIPSGAGSSLAWQKVQQNRDLVPSLDYNYFARSKYAQHHPPAIYRDLMLDPQVRALKKIDVLREMIALQYRSPFAFNVSSLWSAIQVELSIDRTSQTVGYMDHFVNWIDETIVSANATDEHRVNLYELFEEVILLTFIGMADKNSDYLIVSPIINSIIESQSVALGQEPKNERSKQYRDKNIVFYSTHDSVLTMMLHDLGMITIDGSTFHKRLMAAKRHGANDLEKFLDGLMMCNMGLSVKFELWLLARRAESAEREQLRHDDDSLSATQLPVVRLAIYDEADPYGRVVWQPVKLGQICRRRYAELFADVTTTSVEQYYLDKELEASVGLDRDHDCPFELFKRISSPWFLNETLYEKIYNDEL